MARPGTQIISRAAPPPRGAPSETGTWFAVGFAEKGSVAAPVLVTSAIDYENKLGNRQTHSYMYDAMESYFREGGRLMYVSRVVGPGATVAEVTLQDDGALDAITVQAKDPGAWGNDLNVEVQAGDAGGEFKLIISDSDGILETSTSLTSVDDAVSWSADSDYVTVIDEGNGVPAVVAAQDLVGGDDDWANADDTEWQDALDRISKDLGPGQISMPGETDTVDYTSLLAHAEANNRVAILDAPDSGTVSTLTAASSALRALDTARYGALFAPWVNVPGLTSGTTRKVPPSAVVAGIISRNEGRGRSPNEPAAGELGVSSFAVEALHEFNDSTRESLNGSGVNVLRNLRGDVRVYGWRSLVNPSGSSATWVQFSNSRLYMAIAAEADAIAERYVFAQVDGRGRKTSQFGGELSSMLLGFYETDSLYGDSPDEAFSVDVGEQVNPIADLQDGKLRAVIAVRMSPFAELVIIEVVKVALTEELA